ncbi:MAG: heparinase [Hellea sp.]|nr:heparinase [Hellea sp.]
MRSPSVSVLEAIPIRNFRGNANGGANILSGHFIYADQHLDVGRQGDPWPLPAPSERFAYWLHSFNWLWDVTIRGEKEAGAKARQLVDQWIAIYGKWNSYSWENDILANRLYAWMCNWPAVFSVDRLSDNGQNRRSSLYRQVNRLKSSFNQTPDGIPKFKAAAVIAMAGLLRPDKAYDYLNRGLDLLDEQIHLQILPDGGHVSRNPQDCVEALEILTALDQALERRGVEGSSSINRALERLRHVIPFFQNPDGGLASFNGSGIGDTRFIESLLKFSKTSASPFSYCPHTGYQRIHQKETVILIDTGETTPFPFDKQAHLAPLAFEMSTRGGRLIVNCGWSDEQPLGWRDAIRKTAAHTSLTLNDMSAGSVVQTGLKGKLFPDHIETGIDNVESTRREQAEGVWLEMSHSGYVRTTGLSHRRRLYVHESGNDVRGEDSLLVPIGGTPRSNNAIPFEIRFHLHPSVKATLAQDLHSALLIQPGQIGWRFRTDGGPMRIEDSVYLAKGNRPIKSEQIVISGSAFADGDGESKSNRVRWSIRRLEAN